MALPFKAENLAHLDSAPPLVVIVAEDDASLRSLALDALAVEGIAAVEAENAAVAITIRESRADEIDALFTDIQMPGSMDGVELARDVRERWPSIAVLITSGNARVDGKELPTGARFLAKPYDMGQVSI